MDTAERNVFTNMNTTSEQAYDAEFNATLDTYATIYEVPAFLVAVLATLYGTISVITVLGNGLVMTVILKDKHMRTVTNIFIANLAFADIIIGMFCIPFQFHPALVQRWDFPTIICSIAPSFKELSVIVSVFTLTIISLDRYIAVIYPLKAGFTTKQVILCLVFIWTSGILASFPEGYFYSVSEVFDQTTNKNVSFCSPKWPTKNFGTYYHWFLLVIQYLIPLLTITAAYTKISLVIWGTKVPGNTPDRGRDMVRQRIRRKVFSFNIKQYFR